MQDVSSMSSEELLYEFELLSQTLSSDSEGESKVRWGLIRSEILKRMGGGTRNN